MLSAGEVLRSERLKRARNLSELAKETCISTRYLTAIEENDSKTLPGHFFHRNFIRQYAAALGLDDLETKRILELIEPAPEIDPVSALNASNAIAEVEQRSKPLARIPTRVAAALLLVVVLSCSGLYAIWNKAQQSAENSSESPAPDPSLDTANRAIDTRGGADPRTATRENERNREAPAQAPESATYASEDPAKISVNLAATERTWVSLSSAGRTLFSGILDASQTKDFNLSDDGKLLTGNAAGLDVRMNGRPLGPLGHRGQVRVVVFRQDQYEILSPSQM